MKEPEVGEEFDGEVVGIKDFGAFVKLTPGKDGLLHISRVANGRVGKVEDVLALGDVVKVKVLEVDPNSGKISLDRLDKPDAPKGPRLPAASAPTARAATTTTTVRAAAAAAATGTAAATPAAPRAAATKARNRHGGPRKRPSAFRRSRSRQRPVGRCEPPEFVSLRPMAGKNPGGCPQQAAARRSLPLSIALPLGCVADAAEATSGRRRGPAW